MELELKELSDRAEIGRIYRRYMKKDFPANELKPLAMIYRALEQGAYACFALYSGEALLGYAFFYLLRRGAGALYLFDYFAVVPGRRDEGLGSSFLRLLSDALRGADCVVGEVEDPETAADAESRLTRERRLRFYLRNGVLDTGVRSRVYGVDYRVLELPTAGAHAPETVRDCYTALYRSMLPHSFFQKHFLVKE